MSEGSGALPRHVAIILDGNGRWAEKRHLPRVMGHRAGVLRVREVVRACSDKGIEALTLFAFSSENWKRPPNEVQLLMELFMVVLRSEIRAMLKNNVQLRILGDRSAFPAGLQSRIQKAEEQTAKNTGLVLVIAANYGGRWDIATTAQKLAMRVASGEISEITPDLFGQEIHLGNLPEPDLFIRTGGEQRISNFLLWQIAYTELYFTDIFWPDFDKSAFEKALQWFSSRQRRFGCTGSQVIT
ncbi:ditrans,polycis-undecaprenyl-diphosphate synthase ((2E,6E)-farnesyl-diphosphate specific) [Gammaproteobacteria bacterium]